jgi:VanZ family protein
MKSKNLHVGLTATSSRRGAWLAAGLWALLLFVLSSIPGSSFPEVHLPGLDKLVHVGLYSVLGACCAHGLSGSPGRSRWRVVLVATGIALGYGVTDEIHQLFVPNRSADWHDLVADVVGGALGAVLAGWAEALIVARRSRRTSA